MNIKVAYAHGKNKCKTCGNKVEKDQIQLGLDRKVMHWNHLGCFKFPHTYKDTSEIAGFDTLTETDKILVTTHFSDESKRLKAPPTLLHSKHDRSERERDIIKLADHLSPKFKVGEMQKILEINNMQMDAKVTKQALAEVIAMGMIEGSLPKCPNCTSCNLTVVNDYALCSGHGDTTPSCGFTQPLKETERSTWKFLDEKDTELFTKWNSAMKKTDETSNELEQKKPKVE
jgi:hypothetical protein